MNTKHVEDSIICAHISWDCERSLKSACYEGTDLRYVILLHNLKEICIKKKNITSLYPLLYPGVIVDTDIYISVTNYPRSEDICDDVILVTTTSQNTPFYTSSSMQTDAAFVLQGKEFRQRKL